MLAGLIILECDARVKFLSLEPLIDSVDKLDYTGIDWVIVGGESGFGSRVIKKEWVLEIKDRCKKLDIPFFFKQWGGVNKKKAGRLLDGEIYDAMPELEPIGFIKRNYHETCKTIEPWTKSNTYTS